MRRNRMLGLTFLGLLAIGTTGCFTSYRRVPTDLILTTGNEAQVAYEMGRRDGERMHPARMPYALAFALPLGLVAVNQTGEWWAGPATVSAVTVGTALWATNQLNSDLPSPPDSRRVRYNLASDEVWRRYRMGFQDAVYDSRRTTATGSKTSVGFSVGLWVIYLTLRAARR